MGDDKYSPLVHGLVGAVSAGMALSAGELVAGLAGLPSLIAGIATAVIDAVPAPIKDAAIAIFGIYDKLALGIGIVAVTLTLGFAAGWRWSGRSRQVGLLFAVFGVLGALAAARDPQITVVPALLNGGVSVLAGVGAYRLMVGIEERQPDPSRRAVLLGTGAVAILALAAGVGGRLMIDRARRLIAGRADVVLPLPIESAAAPSPGSMLAVEGISPLITPNADFYRIDTVPFSVPRVDLSTWTLSVTGLVDREITLDFAALSDLSMIERYVTLSCVSNRVGGDLVGTALWLGVPLSDILNRAGVRPDAEQIVGRSVDGFTVGFPVEAAFDGRDAVVAVGMNGEPLPLEHGFPARLVVAGLYGYVSATKWLSEIELTTWDGFDAYWVPRGWAKEAPIKTQSRIDTPRHRSEIEAGTRAIAGVAWAPTRGISRVEVQVDEGPWLEAELAEPLSNNTWRQWHYEWNAVPGRHLIRVRATDGLGVTQTGEIRPPAPDGATGWHTVRVDVT